MTFQLNVSWLLQEGTALSLGYAFTTMIRVAGARGSSTVDVEEMATTSETGGPVSTGARYQSF